MLLRRALLALAAGGVAVSLAGCALITITPPARTSAVPADISEKDEDFGTVDVYGVGADGSLSPTPEDEARRVWEMFEQVVTPGYAGATMLNYRVGDSPDSDTLAYVYRDDRDPALWTLAANLAYADDSELLLSTLVHEYGHLLSLDEVDVPPSGRGDCATLALPEGCAVASSAIYAFQTDFWDAYGPAAPDPYADSDDLEFYRAHEEEFVSDYAATSVTEDFAETFMTFVLEERPDAGAALAPKFDFFYDRAEFVDVRDRIRGEFGL